MVFHSKGGFRGRCSNTAYVGALFLKKITAESR